MRKLFGFAFIGLLAAACTSTSTSSDPDDGVDDGDESGLEPPAPEDDVVDEAAGEDALAVVKGEMPGVVVIVEFAEGLEVNATAEALASAYDLVITSRYHDLGGAAFIAPDEPTADQLLLDLRVTGITRDRLVSLSPGDAFDAEVDADLAEAEAAGEYDAEADGAASDLKKVWTVDELRPQRRSTGWRLIRADRVKGDGTGTRVAVIDSGIALYHPDLRAAVADGMGKDCVRRKKKTLYDFNGHGTHVSGIIAAQNNDFGMVGVAPGTRIVPVRVLDKTGSGTLSSVLCGVDYVARRASSINVVNMSLGVNCEEPCANFAPAADDKAIRKLVGKGVTVVVAAGNEGTPASWSAPAYLDEVIAVSAFLDWSGTITSRDRYANFSNDGEAVDIGAPGVRILSTLPNEKYKRMNGTSMAAPFVAAVAAIIIQTQGPIGPAAVRGQLLASAQTSYPGRGGDHPEPLLLVPEGAGGCGDALCLGGETDESCPADCGWAASACDENGPFGCSCAVDCKGDDCCADAGICPIM